MLLISTQTLVTFQTLPTDGISRSAICLFLCHYTVSVISNKQVFVGRKLTDHFCWVSRGQRSGAFSPLRAGCLTRPLSSWENYPNTFLPAQSDCVLAGSGTSFTDGHFSNEPCWWQKWQTVLVLLKRCALLFYLTHWVAAEGFHFLLEMFVHDVINHWDNMSNYCNERDYWWVICACRHPPHAHGRHKPNEANHLEYSTWSRQPPWSSLPLCFDFLNARDW